MSQISNIINSSDIPVVMNWIVVTTATQQMQPGTGYVTNRAGGVTYTLPASASVGQQMIILGLSGISTIDQNAGQSIKVGINTSTVGVAGTVTGGTASDCIELFCVVPGANTTWTSLTEGTWTTA